MALPSFTHTQRLSQHPALAAHSTSHQRCNIAHPFAAYLYDLVGLVYDGDMPNRNEATHSSIMNLWKDLAPGNMFANDAIELLWDFGVEQDQLFQLTANQAKALLTDLRAARASGELLPSIPAAATPSATPPSATSAASPAASAAGAQPQT